MQVAEYLVLRLQLVHVLEGLVGSRLSMWVAFCRRPAYRTRYGHPIGHLANIGAWGLLDKWNDPRGADEVAPSFEDGRL